MVLASLWCGGCSHIIIYLHCYCCYFFYCFRCCWPSFSPKDKYFILFFFFEAKYVKWCNVNSTKKEVWRGQKQVRGSECSATGREVRKHTSNFCCLELVQPASLHNHTNLHRVYVMRSLSVSLSVGRFVCVCVCIHPHCCPSIHLSTSQPKLDGSHQRCPAITQKRSVVVIDCP